jgi:hypothetical protein
MSKMPFSIYAKLTGPELVALEDALEEAYINGYDAGYSAAREEFEPPSDERDYW